MYYTLACALSQTGIRYWVRHLDIISDDRNAATGDEGRRATGGPFLSRSEGHAHRRDIRPLSSSLRFSDGTKESGVLYAVRLASADDSPRPPPSLSYRQVISDNGLHRCVCVCVCVCVRACVRVRVCTIGRIAKEGAVHTSKVTGIRMGETVRVVERS